MNKCQQCQQPVFDTELVAIGDLLTRVKPGERLPSGECPLCGGNCLPEGNDYNEAWMEQFKTQLNSISDGLKGVRNLMIEVDAPVATFAMGGLLSQAFRMYKEVLQAEMGLVLIDESVASALRQTVGDVNVDLDTPSASSMDA